MTTDLDPFIKSSKVAAARGCSTRWLYELVRLGKFPPPDRVAVLKGEPNLWRQSTVVAALDAMARQDAV